MRTAYPSSWCTVHLERISHNLERALKLVPDGRRFCAVLKADAYGHGIHKVVPRVIEQGVDTIGITSNAEAIAVRDAGFKGHLIRLRAAPPNEIEDAVTSMVEEQVSSYDGAVYLRGLQNSGRMKTPVHLALNTEGMSRDALEIGTDAGQETCIKILETLGARICGISTHFASNDANNLSLSNAKFQCDVSWVLSNSDLRRKDIRVHAGSSLTLVSKTPVETDMYRCGAVLYGILKPEWGFEPTMGLHAKVVSLQRYPEGSYVGYDRSARLSQSSLLACISIGYQNGFTRNASDQSVVIIRGTLAPVVGKVSMNAVVVDVSKIAHISVGDTVTVFGDSPGERMKVHQAERQFGTIMADLYCDWGIRNLRIYNHAQCPPDLICKDKVSTVSFGKPI